MGKFIFTVLSVAVFAAETFAWGPHIDITKAALERVPSSPEWADLMDKNFTAQIAGNAFLPDTWGIISSSNGEKFHANDYLQIKGVEVFAQHNLGGSDGATKVPYTQRDAFKAYFKKAVRALQMETPANAARRLGAIIHFTEDCGCPQHTNLLMKKAMRNHKSENFFTKEKIAIPNYTPVLFGDNIDAAADGLIKRLEALDAKTQPIAQELFEKELFKNEKKGDMMDRKVIEPLNFKASKQSAEAVADLVYTALKIGTKPLDGAKLCGEITAPALPLPDSDKLVARVWLLDSNGDITDIDTFTDGGVVDKQKGLWTGKFSLRNLPEGKFKLMAYRQGGQIETSPIFELKKSEPTKVNLALKESSPKGNLVLNSDCSIKTLFKDKPIPDCWYKNIFYYPRKHWLSARFNIEPMRSYKMGVKLKDPSVKVTAIFFKRNTGAGPIDRDSPIICELKDGEDQTVSIQDKKIGYGVIAVYSEKPIGEIIENVWIIPLDKK